MNLTLIIILAVAIVAVSIITAFGKAVGSGGNVSDLFLDQKKKGESRKPEDHSETNEDKRT